MPISNMKSKCSKPRLPVTYFSSTVENQTRVIPKSVDSLELCFGIFFCGVSCVIHLINCESQNLLLCSTDPVQIRKWGIISIKGEKDRLVDFRGWLAYRRTSRRGKDRGVKAYIISKLILHSEGDDYTTELPYRSCIYARKGSRRTFSAFSRWTRISKSVLDIIPSSLRGRKLVAILKKLELAHAMIILSRVAEFKQFNHSDSTLLTTSGSVRCGQFVKKDTDLDTCERTWAQRSNNGRFKDHGLAENPLDCIRGRWRMRGRWALFKSGVQGFLLQKHLFSDHSPTSWTRQFTWDCESTGGSD